MRGFGRFRFSQPNALHMQVRNFAKKTKSKELIINPGVGLYQGAELAKEYARTTRPEAFFRCNMLIDLDPRKKNQNLKSIFALPHATDVKTDIAVITSGEEYHPFCEAEGLKYGGEEFVEELIDKPEDINFTQIIATMDMYDSVKRRLGPVLGPIDLMPSAKMRSLVGTPEDLEKAVQAFRKGIIKIFSGRQGDLEFMVGNNDLTAQQLYENLLGVLTHIQEDNADGKPRKIKALKIVSKFGLTIKINAKYTNPKYFTENAPDEDFEEAVQHLQARTALLDEKWRQIQIQRGLFPSDTAEGTNSTETEPAAGKETEFI